MGQVMYRFERAVNLLEPVDYSDTDWRDEIHNTKPHIASICRLPTRDSNGGEADFAHDYRIQVSRDDDSDLPILKHFGLRLLVMRHDHQINSPAMNDVSEQTKASYEVFLER